MDTLKLKEKRKTKKGNNKSGNGRRSYPSEKVKIKGNNIVEYTLNFNNDTGFEFPRRI